MELEQDLRFTSDEMLRRLDRLRDLEVEKRNLKPGTPGFVKIAAEIEKLAATLFAKTIEQEQLAEETVAARVEHGIEAKPIEQVTPLRDVQLILSEWRDAERRLAAALKGTPEHLEAQAAVKRLRDEYRNTSQAMIRDVDRGGA